MKSSTPPFFTPLPRLSDRPPLPIRQPREHLEGGSSISGGERKILTALAQYPEGRTKRQVAILTGYAVAGGAFQNYIGALRSKGLAVGYGDLKITHAGIDLLGNFTPLPSGQQLLEHWLHQLGKAERLILQYLASVYPQAVTKELLGEAVGYQASGGGFQNAIGRLRTLELIGGRAELRASEEFFQ